MMINNTAVRSNQQPPDTEDQPQRRSPMTLSYHQRKRKHSGQNRKTLSFESSQNNSDQVIQGYSVSASQMFQRGANQIGGQSPLLVANQHRATNTSMNEYHSQAVMADSGHGIVPYQNMANTYLGQQTLKEKRQQKQSFVDAQMNKARSMRVSMKPS